LATTTHCSPDFDLGRALIQQVFNALAGGELALGLVGRDALLAAAEGYALKLLAEVEAELLELVFVAVELDVHKKWGGILEE